MHIYFRGVLGFVLFSFFISFSASGSGYEKPIVWSGHYGGLGGASVSFVEGPESLAFNPAGLAKEKGDTLDLALSPFYTQHQAPVVSDTWGKSVFLLPGALLYSKKVADRLGVGLGVYASGGGAVDMGNISFGSNFPTLHPPFDAQLQYLDFSLGFGYELIEGLRIGAAWRVMKTTGKAHVGALVDTNGDGTPDLLTAYSFENLSATNWTAFRLGLQYEPSARNWGLGVAFRSSVDVEAKGTSSAQVQSSGSSAISSVPGGTVQITTTFPWMLSGGAHVSFLRDWQFVGEYSFAHYSSNQVLAYSGDSIGGVNPSAFNSLIYWTNLHIVRLGTEYRFSPKGCLLRAGWVTTSQVTPNDRANFLNLPPARGYAYTLGTQARALNDQLVFDFALDYSVTVGEGSNAQPGFANGRYETWGATVHTSTTYQFD